MWELDYKESWALKNGCFWTVVLEKTLESPLDCKEIQPVHPKGNQSWIFTGRTDVEAETSILWPPDAKSWLVEKDPDAVKEWRQEEKGPTNDELVGWHHQLHGHGFGWTPGDGDGQEGLACYSPWGCKESDMTERLNWTENQTWFQKLSWIWQHKKSHRPPNMAAPTFMPEWLQISCKEVAVSVSHHAGEGESSDTQSTTSGDESKGLTVGDNWKEKIYHLLPRDHRLDKHGNTWQVGGPTTSEDDVCAPPTFLWHSSLRVEGFLLWAPGPLCEKHLLLANSLVCPVVSGPRNHYLTKAHEAEKSPTLLVHQVE